MNPLLKRAPILRGSFKALDGDEAPGTFEAIIAVFGNIDLYGEVVDKGAFEESFSSDWPKLIWSHTWNQPPIGVTLDIKEVDRGVYAKGRLFVDVDSGEDNQRAREIWTALKATDPNGDAALDEFSYHYVPVDAGIETRDGERVYAIKKASMTEWGPCLKGVNPETELLNVKGVDARRAGLPGYDPAVIDRVKSLADNPQPNASTEAEEAAARTRRKAYLDLEFATRL